MKICQAPVYHNNVVMSVLAKFITVIQYFSKRDFWPEKNLTMTQSLAIYCSFRHICELFNIPLILFVGATVRTDSGSPVILSFSSRTAHCLGKALLSSPRISTIVSSCIFPKADSCHSIVWRTGVKSTQPLGLWQLLNTKSQLGMIEIFVLIPYSLCLALKKSLASVKSRNIGRFFSCTRAFVEFSSSWSIEKSVLPSTLTRHNFHQYYP